MTHIQSDGADKQDEVETQATDFVRVFGRPAVQCARPMRAASWCRRPVNHDGRCDPSIAPSDQGCTIPPPGWWCSRTPGHEPPCAARPSTTHRLSETAMNDFTCDEPCTPTAPCADCVNAGSDLADTDRG